MSFNADIAVPVPVHFDGHNINIITEFTSQSLPKPVDHQSLFKTELCREWAQSGWCYYGKRCSFSHGLQELRPVFRSRKWRTKRCRNWDTKGYCPYEHRCQFLHGPASQSESTFSDSTDSNVNDNTAGLPQNMVVGNDNQNGNGMVNTDKNVSLNMGNRNGVTNNPPLYYHYQVETSPNHENDEHTETDADSDENTSSEEEAGEEVEVDYQREDDEEKTEKLEGNDENEYGNENEKESSEDESNCSGSSSTSPSMRGYKNIMIKNQQRNKRNEFEGASSSNTDGKMGNKEEFELEQSVKGRQGEAGTAKKEEKKTKSKLNSNAIPFMVRTNTLNQPYCNTHAMDEKKTIGESNSATCTEKRIKNAKKQSGVNQSEKDVNARNGTKTSKKRKTGKKTEEAGNKKKTNKSKKPKSRKHGKKDPIIKPILPQTLLNMNINVNKATNTMNSSPSGIGSSYYRTASMNDLNSSCNNNLGVPFVGLPQNMFESQNIGPLNYGLMPLQQPSMQEMNFSYPTLNLDASEQNLQAGTDFNAMASEYLASLTPAQLEYVSAQLLAAAQNVPIVARAPIPTSSGIQKNPNDTQTQGNIEGNGNDNATLNTRNLFSVSNLGDLHQSSMTPVGTPGIEDLLQFPLPTPSPSPSMLNSTPANLTSFLGSIIPNGLARASSNGSDFGFTTSLNPPTPTPMNLFSSLNAVLNSQGNLHSMPVATPTQTPVPSNIFSSSGGTSTTTNTNQLAGVSSLLSSSMSNLLNATTNLTRSKSDPTSSSSNTMQLLNQDLLNIGTNLDLLNVDCSALVEYLGSSDPSYNQALNAFGSLCLNPSSIKTDSLVAPSTFSKDQTADVFNSLSASFNMTTTQPLTNSNSNSNAASMIANNALLSTNSNLGFGLNSKNPVTSCVTSIAPRMVANTITVTNTANTPEINPGQRITAPVPQRHSTNQITN